MTFRPAEERDIPLAAQWWKARGGGVFWSEVVERLKIGVVAEDEHGPAGMVWVVFWCNVSVAQLEFLVMRPGLSLKQARDAGKAMMAGVSSALRALDITHCIAYSLPACARTLRALGWQEADERPKTAMLQTL